MYVAEDFCLTYMLYGTICFLPPNNLFLKSIPSISECQCETIGIFLKNRALSAHPSKQGNYTVSEKVNGKTSWISNTSAIWYKNGVWTVGKLEDKGETENNGIETEDGYGDLHCPYDIKRWFFYDGVIDNGWALPDFEKDIRIQCLDGKYF